MSEVPNLDVRKTTEVLRMYQEIRVRRGASFSVPFPKTATMDVSAPSQDKRVSPAFRMLSSSASLLRSVAKLPLQHGYLLLKVIYAPLGPPPATSDQATRFSL